MVLWAYFVLWFVLGTGTCRLYYGLAALSSEPRIYNPAPKYKAHSTKTQPKAQSLSFPGRFG